MSISKKKKIILTLAIIVSALVLITQLSAIGLAQSSGIITTVAGNGMGGFGGDGGPAVSAQLSGPTDVAFDSSGNLLIADCNNSRVRKVAPDGVISTVVDFSFGGLSLVDKIGLDTAGNLYATYYEYDGWTETMRVIKVTPEGMQSVVLGGGRSPLQDGVQATLISAEWPTDIAIDSEGNLYCALSDIQNDRGWIVKVTLDGIVHIIAGGGTQEPRNGIPALLAKLVPIGLALDKLGSIYISDYVTSSILQVTPDGLITIVAGNGTRGYSGDGGPANLAQLNQPLSLAIDSAGNLYVSDSSNHRIRKVNIGLAATYFPFVTAGGGWSTLFTFINTGLAETSGKLILRDPQGNPLTVNGELTDSSGTTQPVQQASSFTFSVPSAGSIHLSVDIPEDISIGWVQLESTGSSLSGMATHEYISGAKTESLFNVPQSSPLNFAVIPVDIDKNLDKLQAYVITNPNSHAISVNIMSVAQDGTVVGDSVVINLGPGEQTSRYLTWDLASTKFRGSLVIRGQRGQTFVVLALLVKQGVFAAIPLIKSQ